MAIRISTSIAKPGARASLTTSGGGGVKPGLGPAPGGANRTNSTRAKAGGSNEIVAISINLLCHSGRLMFATALAKSVTNVRMAVMGTMAATRAAASCSVPIQCVSVFAATINPVNNIAVAKEIPTRPNAR